jgi:hypothetical protein
MTPQPPTTTPLWKALDNALNLPYAIHRTEWAQALDLLADRFESYPEVYATLRYEADRARNPTHLP